MRRLTSGLETLTGLAVALGLIACLTAATGMTLVALSAVDDATRDIGRWCLQLALVFAGTGVVGVVVRQYELVRARRDAWAEMLHELIGAHDETQMAVRLLEAHATAKTYAEQITVLTNTRGTLRRLSSAPEVQREETLHHALLTMREYLKKVITEYQAKYLAVARQQRLDEVVLTQRLKRLAESEATAFPQVPIELTEPLPAGLALQDARRFPRLNEFRTGFQASEFRTAYEVATPIMQRNAGVRAGVDPAPSPTGPRTASHEPETARRAGVSRRRP